jgi:hypothetical protein
MRVKARMHVPMKGLDGSNPPLSANESFSVYNSAKDDRNMRLRGQFRTARGSGERSEPRIRPVCGSFYPRKSDSGPRRKCARQLAQLEAFISLRSNLGKNLAIERHAASE